MMNTAKPTNPKDAVGIRKAPLSTLPANVLLELDVEVLHPVVLYEAGLGMMEGARKYGRHNYRETGVRSSVYYDATMRHVNQWWSGENMDPDSNLHHVTKAICSNVVLRDAMMQGMLTDDRPPKSKGWDAHWDGEFRDARTYYRSISTAMMAWWEGVDKDPTLANMHLITFSTLLLFRLRASMLPGALVKLNDNRPNWHLQTGWLSGLNAAAGNIIDKYPDAKDPITEVGRAAALANRPRPGAEKMVHSGDYC